MMTLGLPPPRSLQMDKLWRSTPKDGQISPRPFRAKWKSRFPRPIWVTRPSRSLMSFLLPIPMAPFPSTQKHFRATRTPAAPASKSSPLLPAMCPRKMSRSREQSLLPKTMPSGRFNTPRLRISTPDPDYVEISSGNTDQYNAALATFPTTSLADGIYLIRVVAQGSGGGETSYHGQVIGVNVDPATLRPQIEIHSPLPDGEIDLAHDVRASLASDRPITSWTVAYADRTKVDLANLGGEDSDWVEIASGTGVFDDQAIGVLDTTRMKNGSYVAKVTAFNDLRLGRLEAVEFEGTSPAKPGRNRREFIDAEIDLAGFRLQL